jgi:tight adherence protein B
LVEFAGLLTGIAVLILFYGIKKVLTPAVKLSRFKTQRYAIDNDDEYLKNEKELRQIEKLYKVDNTKKALLFIVGAVTCGLVGYLISGRFHIALVSSFFGVVVPVAWEKWHIDGQKKQMERQFEQAAEQMAMVIKSGGSIQSAVERAAQEAGYPLKRELDLMAAQMKLNIPTAEVFKWAMERIPVPELDMLVIVSSLQQSGLAVNTAAALERIQESIRARRGFKEQIDAITAEGRLTSKIVAAMPFLVIGFIRKVAPQFVEPLFSTVWGMGLLGLSVLAIFGGMVWINSIIQIES